jgi:hypothetical protein
VKSIRSDDEIKIVFRSTFEGDVNDFVGLVDSGHAIAKDRLDFAFQQPKNRYGQISSWKGDKAAASDARECIDWRSGYFFPCSIDNPQLLDPVSFAGDFGQQAHAVRDFVTCAQKSIT